MNHTFFIKCKQFILSSSIIVSILLGAIPFTPAFAYAAGPVDVWWPTNSSTLSGTQPFKALVEGLDVSSYDMYWQVDGGQLNPMQTNTTDYPHKETTVDVSGWDWHGTGPYAITFVAKQNGNTIAQQTVSVTITGATNATPAPTPAPQQIAQPAPAPQPIVPAAPAPQITQPAPVAPTPVVAPTPAPSPVAASINVWWPTANVTVTGTQPFKAAVSSLDVNAYKMYWQVDGGQLNEMQTNTTDAPHKESSVNLSGWSWQSSGKYTLTFVAKDLNGNTIATQSETITIPNAQLATNPASVPTQTTTPVVQAPTSVATDNSTSQFYVDPNSAAAQQAKSWASSDSTDAAKMQTLASQPTAVWFGNWNSNIQSDVAATVSAAANAGKTALLVAYNIPNRDCGGYSAGGTSDYLNWIKSFAAGIGNRSAWVVLEPDAVAQSSCLSSSDQSTRFNLLSQAVSILKANPNTKVYIDAGHAGWVDTNTMAANLQKAGIAQADGFSLNVSNYDASANENAYGQQLSGALGGKHFVVDTSRNGNGNPSGSWCNVSGSAIGNSPSTQTGVAGLDANLWIKVPGESDGNCNGGPNAGNWWSDFALALVNNKH